MNVNDLFSILNDKLRPQLRELSKHEIVTDTVAPYVNMFMLRLSLISQKVRTKPNITEDEVREDTCKEASACLLSVYIRGWFDSIESRYDFTDESSLSKLRKDIETLRIETTRIFKETVTQKEGNINRHGDDRTPRI